MDVVRTPVRCDGGKTKQLTASCNMIIRSKLAYYANLAQNVLCFCFLSIFVNVLFKTDPPKVFDIEDDHDEDTCLSSDTLTWINQRIEGGTSMGGKTKTVDEKQEYSGAVGGNMIVDLLSENPILGLVTRVLDDMVCISFL
ncbi:hypothetical protein DPMN_130153 [Dreissena polymorpha]|uniref:Uncharacterized protein n=1 Tax=Dreissena polymorpha TaxID=45954 RepID=A0A9D4JY56_DREPO|nr:hypothetical protein DPMN_130153 [Dreissena polymorpha]